MTRDDGRPRSPREIRADVDEELRFHLDTRIAALIDQGLSPAEAREEALRRFGNVDTTRAACVEHDLRRERVRQRRELARAAAADARVALRRIRRQPAFAAVIVLTLGAGIGAATAIFSAADHVLWRPLPVASPDRVVTLWETDRRTGETEREVSPGNFIDWRRLAASFDAMGLAEPFGFDLESDGPPESLRAWLVTDGFFPALGVAPLRGRLFLPEDFPQGAPPVVVLSHAFWQRRFGGDPSVVGRPIRLDGQPTVVVGVLPPGLDYPRGRRDVWAPRSPAPRDLPDRVSSYTQVVGRLRPGVDARAAQQDLDRVAALVAAEHPDTNRTSGIRAKGLTQHLFGDVRPALLVLLGAVALVLLAGCVNAANVLLAEAVRRQHELAVRSAIGASPARLCRQLVTESAVLAVLGGALGVAIAAAGVHLFVALAPGELPRMDTIRLDGRPLLFAIALTFVTVMIFGLAPALRAARADAAAALRAATVAGREHRRLRGLLLSAQVGLALVLLIGAGLLARSFAALRGNDLGFDPEGVAELQVFLYDRNPTPELRRQRIDAIAAALRTAPGVDAVGVVTALPFHPSQIDAQSAVEIEGVPGTNRRVYTTAASPEYFRALGIALRRGRAFERTDGAGTPNVALVNEAFARAIFPGDSPLGKKVRVGVMGRPAVRDIVGVVADVRPTTLDSEPRPEIYVPMAQAATGSVTFVVSATNPGDLLPTLREKLWGVDPGQSIYHSGVVTDLIADTLAERRFHLAIVVALSLSALLIAAAGVYGLTSFDTSRRTREIGVRMALGARARDVVTMVVAERVRAALPGVVLGLAGAGAVAHLLAHLLYHVAPVELPTYGVLAAGMLVVVAVAAYFPARRAAMADPLRSLRTE